VVDAVECAIEIQKELKTRNAGLRESRRMEFRIGVNLGDVIEEGDKIFGDGVNIAARWRDFRTRAESAFRGPFTTKSKISWIGNINSSVSNLTFDLFQTWKLLVACFT
jgi:hypothetical protein